MRKSSLILLLAMAFVLATVASSFSRGSVVEGPCKEPCKKWAYQLYLQDENDCDSHYQQADTCPPCPLFDYESALGYCGYNSGDNYYNAAGVVFKVCDCPDVTFDINKSYGIRIEIVEPVKGVYFTNGNDSGDDYDGCAGDGCPDGDQNIFVSSLGDTTDESRFCPEPCDGTPFVMGYEPVDDSDVLFDSAIHNPAAGEECCLDCIGNLSSAIQTTCLQPFMFAASPYILIDIPTMVWDPKIMTTGDEVVIKVTITGEPGSEVCPECNDICSCTIKVGIFGCPAPKPASRCNTCFPYFTSIDDADWWAGFALTNAGSAADAKMTFYAGGSSVTYNIPLLARSVNVYALSQIPELSALAGKGEIYATVVSTVPLDDGGTLAAQVTGFAIMGDGAQAYGYLSKAGVCGCNDCCD